MPGGDPSAQPTSTKNTDTKKSEKVKNFYSSLLKKKDNKNRQSIAELPKDASAP
jgi:hypothetical protein